MTRGRWPEADLRRLARLWEAAHAPPSWLDRLLRRSDPRLPALDELAHIAPPLYVTGLIKLAQEPGELGLRAGRAIAAILAQVTPGELAYLDEALRADRGGDEGSRNLEPRSLAELSRRHACEPAVLGALAGHRSGYVREAALKQLAAVRDGRELRYLALRANDWVDPVAALAKSLLRERLVPANRAVICRELPFLSRLGERSRRDPGELVAALGEVLRSDGGRDLVAISDSLDRETRRRAYRWLFARALPLDAPGSVAALSHSDGVIQLVALRALASGPEAEGVTGLLAGAARSRSPFVRAETLRLWPRVAAAEAPARTRDALFDRSALVRRRARWLARDLGLELDPRALLREALAGGHAARVSAAVELVGERGSNEDVAAVAALLTHSSSAVRASALAALARLASAEATSHAAARLTDPVRAVRSVALQVLRLHCGDVDYAAIAAAARASADPAVRRDSLGFVARASKWQALEYLLQALPDPDESVRARSRALVDYWCARFNRSFAQPTQSQAEVIGRLRREVRARTPRKLDELLTAVLGPA